MEFKGNIMNYAGAYSIKKEELDSLKERNTRSFLMFVCFSVVALLALCFSYWFVDKVLFVFLPGLLCFLFRFLY